MTEIPQAALRARQMYAEGRTVRAIQAETGLNLDQLYHALDGLPQPNGDSLLPPIPRRRRKEPGKGGEDYWEEMKGTDAWQRSRRPSHSARISRRAFP